MSMRPPLAQPLTLDFDLVWVRNPGRGRVLLGVLSSEEVGALLAQAAAASASAASCFVQASDPGAVGPFKLWVDTSGGPGKWILKVRDGGNLSWECLAPLVQNQGNNKHYRLSAGSNAEGVNEVFLEDSPVD